MTMALLEASAMRAEKIFLLWSNDALCKLFIISRLSVCRRIVRG